MGRCVFITGRGSGIGRVMAEAFLALGDQVAVCYYDQTCVHHLEAAHLQCLSYYADVRDEDAVTEFFANVDEAFGGVDILVSNTGMGGPAGGFETLIYKDWRSCISVNLDGAFPCCWWTAKRMKEQKSGLILMISSTSGLFGVPHRSPYVSAEWGLIGLMKSIAVELGSANVRVNAICPGAVEGERIESVLSIESDGTGHSIADIRQQYTEGVSLRRFIAAQDIAVMALYLASEAGRNVSGQAISVDGNTERMV